MSFVIFLFHKSIQGAVSINMTDRPVSAMDKEHRSIAQSVMLIEIAPGFLESEPALYMALKSSTD